MSDQDLIRLRQEYEDRKKRGTKKDIYSFWNKSNLFTIQQRQRTMVSTLKQFVDTSHQDRNILEIGCGAGGVLNEYKTFGLSRNQLFGIDLLLDRLVEANRNYPYLGVSCADGQKLPYQNDSFDLVLQYTAFTSVLDFNVKQNMAHEMLRVLKEDGIIIWYDFWLNPTNPQTKGVKPKEIRTLFPGCEYHFHKVTLAPPIARRIVPFSWPLALILESVKIFNSHYFAIIKKIK